MARHITPIGCTSARITPIWNSAQMGERILTVVKGDVEARVPIPHKIHFTCATCGRRMVNGRLNTYCPFCDEESAFYNLYRNTFTTTGCRGCDLCGIDGCGQLCPDDIPF